MRYQKKGPGAESEMSESVVLKMSAVRRQKQGEKKHAENKEIWVKEMK